MHGLHCCPPKALIYIRLTVMHLRQLPVSRQFHTHCEATEFAVAVTNHSAVGRAVKAESESVSFDEAQSKANLKVKAR